MCYSEHQFPFSPRGVSPAAERKGQKNLESLQKDKTNMFLKYSADR